MAAAEVAPDLPPLSRFCGPLFLSTGAADPQGQVWLPRQQDLGVIGTGVAVSIRGPGLENPFHGRHRHGPGVDDLDSKPERLVQTGSGERKRPFGRLLPAEINKIVFALL